MENQIQKANDSISNMDEDDTPAIIETNKKEIVNLQNMLLRMLNDSDNYIKSYKRHMEKKIHELEMENLKLQKKFNRSNTKNAKLRQQLKALKK